MRDDNSFFKSLVGNLTLDRHMLQEVKNGSSHAQTPKDRTMDAGLRSVEHAHYVPSLTGHAATAPRTVQGSVIARGSSRGCGCLEACCGSRRGSALLHRSYSDRCQNSNCGGGGCNSNPRPTAHQPVSRPQTARGGARVGGGGTSVRLDQATSQLCRRQLGSGIPARMLPYQALAQLCG